MSNVELSKRRGLNIVQLRPDSPVTVQVQTPANANEVNVTDDGQVEFSAQFPIVSMNDLDILEDLGRGASSKVMKVLHKPSNQIFALKRIKYTEKREVLHLVVSEIHALRVLHHENIVQLYSVFHMNQHINILMSLIDGGSLADYLKVYPQIPEPALGRICWHCIQGLLFLRRSHYLHRDLKPSNILISKAGEVKIADFGMARQLSESMDQAQSFLGTFCYMAPERIQSEKYSFKSDIWSFGLIIYQCAYGKFPYPGDPKNVNFWDIAEKYQNDIDVMLPPGYSPALKELISGCLRVSVNERDSIEQINENQWARQFSDPKYDRDLLAYICEANHRIEVNKENLKRSLEEFGTDKANKF